MSSHTPGPWEAFKGGYAVGSQQGTCVATLPSSSKHHPEDSEREANARLISAAPDLLSALTILLKMIEDGDFTTLELNEARAAIAKATKP